MIVIHRAPPPDEDADVRRAPITSTPEDGHTLRHAVCDAPAALDPTLRERHAADHVPPGFSDAVGWMGEQPGAARWAVTFAADGTDAVAARAVGLGGEVVTPPFDAGPTRVAVLRDREGAPFTVSTHTP